MFNKKTTQNRFAEIDNEIENIADGWYPKFNNAEELCIKNGGEWETTPIPMIKANSDKEAYADMPIELEQYLRGLPEFEEKIFNIITGRV